MNANLSPSFLADLAQVCASVEPQPLSGAFLADLAKVFESLPLASDANLEWLAIRLTEWRNTTAEFVHRHLLDLQLDDPLLCPISLFGTMDYGRLETAHTRTLAWLLDPTKNHDFSDVLLVALLRRLAREDHFDSLRRVHVASERPIDVPGVNGRLDVLAEGFWECTGKLARWTLVIEAKVDAWEGEAQLDKYDEWLRSHAPDSKVFRVFLTSDGRTSSTGNEEWEPLSFLELVQIFRPVYFGLQHKAGFNFLKFYLAGVLKDVCHFPHNIGDDAADPFAVAAYLKTAFHSDSKGPSHDAAR